jgi:putative membrane protein
VPATSPPPPTSPDDESVDRRTSLAGERTLLAWWRTGLTAIAVALAVGRVLPELASDSPRWPYVVIGVGFGLYGIALIAYGTRRIATLNSEIGVPPQDRPALREMGVLAAVGVVLGLGSIALILVQ